MMLIRLIILFLFICSCQKANKGFNELHLPIIQKKVVDKENNIFQIKIESAIYYVKKQKLSVQTSNVVMYAYTNTMLYAVNMRFINSVYTNRQLLKSVYKRVFLKIIGEGIVTEFVFKRIEINCNNRITNFSF